MNENKDFIKSIINDFKTEDIDNDKLNDYILDLLMFSKNYKSVDLSIMRDILIIINDNSINNDINLHDNLLHYYKNMSKYEIYERLTSLHIYNNLISDNIYHFMDNDKLSSHELLFKNYEIIIDNIILNDIREKENYKNNLDYRKDIIKSINNKLTYYKSLVNQYDKVCHYANSKNNKILIKEIEYLIKNSNKKIDKPMKEKQINAKKMLLQSIDQGVDIINVIEEEIENIKNIISMEEDKIKQCKSIITRNKKYLQRLKHTKTNLLNFEKLS